MLNLLFPRLCNGCSTTLNKGENVLCASCLYQIPTACCHRNGDDSIKRLFYGRVSIEEATALLEYQKDGVSQRLIHNLKYRRQKHISRFLGNWLGVDLVESGRFNTVDLVLPIPLHPSRRRSRGYNQVSGFGSAIALKLGKPFYENILFKKQPTASQVFKSRLKRYQGDKGFYFNQPDIIKDTHVLLVDDLITSGATIESCAVKLFEAEISKLSIATMARA